MHQKKNLALTQVCRKSNIYIHIVKDVRVCRPMREDKIPECVNKASFRKSDVSIYHSMIPLTLGTQKVYVQWT